MSDRHPQDDLLIVDALVRHYHYLENGDPAAANRALKLAVEIAATQGLTIRDAQRQLERSSRRE